MRWFVSFDQPGDSAQIVLDPALGPWKKDTQPKKEEEKLVVKKKKEMET